jgi:predicted TIM-barrel fold metal-dependent hydrolase
MFAREPMDELWKVRTEAMAKYFKGATDRPTVTEVAAYYRERRIGCVIFPVDSERASGERRVSNEEVAELAAQNSDVMIPFASRRAPRSSQRNGW